MQTSLHHKFPEVARKFPGEHRLEYHLQKIRKAHNCSEKIKEGSVNLTKATMCTYILHNPNLHSIVEVRTKVPISHKAV
jgi:hypothetical protein